jgi:hypothetical protein
MLPVEEIEAERRLIGVQEMAMAQSSGRAAEVEQLAHAVETGDGRSVCSFLGTDDIFGLNPAGFASASIDFRLTMLAGAVTPLVHGRDLARGAAMAEALLIAARRAYTSMPTGMSAENYGAAADLAATAWQRLGRQAEIVALARDVAPGILQLTNGYRSTNLTARGVDSLIELGRIDEAQALLEQAKRYDDWYLAKAERREPNLPFTEARLRQALRQAVDPVDTRTADAKAAASHADSIRRILATLPQLGTALPRSLFDQLAEAAAADTPPSTAREVLDRASDAYGRLGTMLGVSDELMRNQIEIQNAGRLLLDPSAGRDPVRLRSMCDRLGKAQAWFAASGHQLDALDALWPIAVISRRLNEHAAALEVMGGLRQAIERRGAGISDPLQTAALFSRFPYLYENIVLSALELGRVDEALSAMEASKGRVIAELRSRRDAARDEEFARETQAIAGAIARLDQLIFALQVDYLSFFVAEDETIIVHVAPSGARHVGRITISKSRLRELMRQVDPGGWSCFGATPVDRELAPLVEWVLPHLTASTLVISPDDPLHNLPFH